MAKQGGTYDGLAKNQHYVPQCLLGGFATGKARGKFEQIWVCDKQSDREPYETAIRNVAAEKGFYNLPTGTAGASFEPLLARLEDLFAPLVRRIRAEESIGWLSDEDREVLALFAIAQMHRTNSFRLLLSDMTSQLAAHLRQDAAAMGVPEPKIDKVVGPTEMTEDELKKLALQTLARAPVFVPLLLAKSLVLGRAAVGHHFMISDNPAALHNSQDRWPRGSLGLGVEGIELYLPISSKLVLWWVCPSYEQQLRRHKGFLPFAVGPYRESIKKELESMQPFLDAIDKGTPLEFNADNVLSANSLQVISAERFVYSSREDFALVREMVRDDPTLKQGRRMVVQ